VVKIWASPLTLPMGLNTVWRYCATCDPVYAHVLCAIPNEASVQRTPFLILTRVSYALAHASCSRVVRPSHSGLSSR